MIKFYAFIGGESSGKTTISKLAAQEYDCPWVAEYGRQLYDELHGKMELEHMDTIVRQQFHNEWVAMNCSGFKNRPAIFCDTTSIVTKFYSKKWYGEVSDVVQWYVDSQSYDHVFLCKNDFPFVQDGTRQSLEFALEQYEFYLDYLTTSSQAYTILSGSTEERMKKIREVVDIPVKMY